MALWLLKPHNAKEDPRWGYDCHYGMVVRANLPSHARAIAADQFGDEGSEVWLDPKATSCKKIKTEGKPEVILKDFRAG